jgi:NAD(P)-dependent dehydrogenase (short-subunit alcohol dehydrogenase family)
MTDLFSISGKTALVTGGSRGIGLMIAEGFVRAGAKVYISSRKADVCAEVAESLSKLGTCIALPADLSTEEECRRLAAEMAEREPTRPARLRCTSSPATSPSASPPRSRSTPWRPGPSSRR